MTKNMQTSKITLDSLSTDLISEKSADVIIGELQEARNFGRKIDTLPPHVLAGIEKSIKQYENGETISYEEFKQKHFSKKYLKK